VTTTYEAGLSSIGAFEDRAEHEEGDVIVLAGRSWRIVKRTSMFGGVAWLQCEEVSAPDRK
jgi:Lhr-like helicase